MAKSPSLIGALVGAGIITSGSGNTPLSISGTPGPATVGVAYSFIPTITGGSGTKTVTLSSGSLAGTGLSINSATGEVSGTPLSAGSIAGLGFTVTDTAGGSATMTGKSIVVGAGAPSAWQSMLDNGQPAVWFDASDTATISATAGLVDSWANKGTAGGQATGVTTARPTSGANTVNGKNVLDFTGSNHMDISSESFAAYSGAYTAFYCYRNDETTATARFVFGGAAAGAFKNGIQLNVGGTANRLYTYSGGTAVYTPASNQGMVITSARAQNNSAATLGAKTLYAFFNGSEPNGYNIARTDSVIDAMRIGGNPINTSSRFKGAWCEILIFPRVLSLDEHQIVEGYLAAKWGMSLLDQTATSGAHPWNGKDPRSNSRVYNVACWGDSFTETAFLTTHWPDLLAASIGRKAYNGGKGGKTSSDIKTLYFDIDERYTDRIRIIEVGRNNFFDAGGPAQIKADIAAMYSPKSIVCSIVNNTDEYPGGANAANRGIINQLNSDLAALYGANFLDIRQKIIDLGAVGQPFADATSQTRGVTPVGLQYGPSPLHHNDAAQPYWAQYVKDKITALGY